MPRNYIRTTSKPTMSWAFRQLPFWERVAAQTERVGECLLFTGAKDDCGYGRIQCGNKKLVRLHRAVWERDHGAIPDDKEVCHSCDVRNCIESKHLFLGTHVENIKDMDAKGRRRVLRGSEQGCSILIESDIPVIRKRLMAGETCAGISRSYGVSEGLIRHIKKKRIWKHVE